MGNVLKIKSRQTGSAGAPSSLARAEVAYDELGEIFYIGHGSGTDASRSKNAIGGVGAFVDKGTAQTITGAKTMSSSSNAFTGDGSALTSLNATQLTSGTVPVGRLDNASTTQEGIVELATGAETNTGTSTTKAVTPDGLDDWTGSAQIVTVGTIANGTWNATAIAAGKLPALDGITAPANNLSLNSKRITSLATPNADTDAATKGYVDSKAQGLDVKESVRLATAADLPACTYAQPDSTSGDGATLTANANGALTIDSVAVALNDRILVQHQGSGTETHAHNGIYTVTTLGTGSAAWVLTRATDFDENDEITSAAFVFVEAGSTNADSGFVCTTDGDITFSSDTFSGVGWTQFSGSGSITAGDGIAQSGVVLSADLKTNGGLVIESSKIAVKLDASSITGTLAISDGGTGATSASAARTALGVAIGSDVQAYDAQLADIAGLTPTNNEFIVGNGSNFDTETPAQARTSLGLGSIATQASTAVNITGGTITMGTADSVTIDCGTF